MTRLSHSQANKYLECGKAYEYHYIDKLRPLEQSAALLFGTAIDKSGEHYLINRNVEEALNVFYKLWETQDINGKPTELKLSTKIVYGNNDFDAELLDESDHKLITEVSGNENVLQHLENIYTSKEAVGFKYLEEKDKVVLNLSNWLCLRKKGKYMLTAFMKQVDDNVLEVLGTQVKAELENSSGDSVIGYLDFVVRWKGEEEPVIFDLKTSAREYKSDSVVTKPQLPLYVFALKHKFENTNRAGYIVLNKNLNKNRIKTCSKCGFDGTGQRHKTCSNEIDGVRCHGSWNETINPSANVQVIIDTVPELIQQRVAENFDVVNKGIKAEVFPRNFESCIKYGTIKCAFYDICHSNNTEGLIKEEKK